MTSRRHAAAAASILLCTAVGVPCAVAADSRRAGDEVAVGRHLVRIAGCNDCHSPGYAQNNGGTPESTWLTGDRLGWRGPWGTTYATNLRLYLAGMSEAQWLRHARTMEPRPPMPWFNVRAMTDRELRAIYRYVRAAGPAGEPAPAYVPPGQPTNGPVVQFP